MPRPAWSRLDGPLRRPREPMSLQALSGRSGCSDRSNIRHSRVYPGEAGTTPSDKGQRGHTRTEPELVVLARRLALTHVSAQAGFLESDSELGMRISTTAGLKHGSSV